MKQPENQGQTRDRPGSVPVLLVEDRGAVRILTMNRPEKRNALNSELTHALLDALRAAHADESVAAIILTGTGPGFCAGADLSEFKDLQEPEAADRRAELTMQLHLAFSRISKPVVTAINGAAMGGGAGLAIAGDLAVMAESAKLGYPEAKHGIVAAIVMANLVRQVGRKSAFELVALGEPMSARRAFELGMVNRVVPDADLMREALSLAEKLAALARPAMAETKRLFHEVADLPLAEALERGRDTNRRMRNFQKLRK
jgi:enoyl-CoA hydratase/carnithine racemase